MEFAASVFPYIILLAIMLLLFFTPFLFSTLSYWKGHSYPPPSYLQRTRLKWLRKRIIREQILNGEEETSYSVEAWSVVNNPYLSRKELKMLILSDNRWVQVRVASDRRTPVKEYWQLAETTEDPTGQVLEALTNNDKVPEELKTYIYLKEEAENLY